jgi:hypothetical protein
MKQIVAKLFFIAMAAVGIATVSPANTFAADSTLQMTINSKNPASSSITLKNTGSTACYVATTATGTVAITKVVQNGQEIVPTPIEVSLEEGLDYTLPGQLVRLQKGEPLEVPLRVTKSGDVLGLRSIVWSPDDGTLGLLYIVKPNQPLQLELNYSVPIDSPDDTPMCGGALASNIDTGNWWGKPIVFALGVIAIVILAVLIWWFLKHRKKKPSVVAMLAIMATVTLLGMQSQPAQARVTVPPSVQAEWDSCMGTLRANSDITGPILNLIDNPDVNIIIDPVDRGGTEASSPWPDGSYHIDWNVNDRHRYAGTGGNADPCTSMYHELYHILDMENRTFSRDDCAGSGIETKEVMATRAQNALRARLGMPERSHYGDRPLPTGDCRATPPPPPCRSSGCGRSVGEPHLLTFDGHHYDFQAAGEFVLARAKDADFEVQVRQQQWQDSRWVAVNTAAVIKTANHKIEVAPNGYKLAVLVDGQKQALEPTELSGGDSLFTTPNSNRLDITTKSGSVVSFFALGNYGVDVSVDPSEDFKGKFEGLLGNFDGEGNNDLRLQGKDTAIKSDFDQLYPAFSDSWRVSDQTSLFSYPEGKNTASYTNRAFPYERADPKKLAGYVAAEELCKRMGVTDETSLAECAMDVAITGRPEFARSAARHQVTITGSSEGAENYTLEARNSGDIGKITFTGKKDEKIFVDVFSSTFPASCGTISIRDADDKTLESGCIINGKGYIETTILSADGTYSVQLRASENTTGNARVRLYRITDQTGTITPDGDAVTANITRPGMKARFTFNGSVGQRLFADTSNVTLPSQCSPIAIVAPSGDVAGSGCIINAKGSVDTTVLKENGQYTLLVNPSDITTGKVTLKLNTSKMISKTINVGDATKLEFAKPGDEAEVRFNGTAGQRIYVDVFESTLSSQCGGFGLRMPNDEKVDGCVIGKEDSLKEDGIVLPVSGTYTVFFNPAEANTGELMLRVR